MVDTSLSVCLALNSLNSSNSFFLFDIIEKQQGRVIDIYEFQGTRSVVSVGTCSIFKRKNQQSPYRVHVLYRCTMFMYITCIMNY